MARTTIIGIGNTMMGDDGIGVRTAEALAERDLGPDVDVVIGSTAGMALVRYFLDSDVVIVLDGLDVGDEPGSVYRFDADDAGVGSLRSHTSHGISVPDLLQAARLRGSTTTVLIYGVQVGDVSMRIDELTPALEKALSEVADMVAAEVASATSREPRAEGAPHPARLETPNPA